MDGSTAAVIVDGLPISLGLEITGSSYPSDTFAVLGMLRQAGLDIDFEVPLGLHPLVHLDASDGYLVPVMRFSPAGLHSLEAQLLPAIIRARVSATRSFGKVHCRIGLDDGQQGVKWFTTSNALDVVVGGDRSIGALDRWIEDAGSL